MTIDYQHISTPISEIIHFLGEFDKQSIWNPKNKFIIDPCAGGCPSNPVMPYPEAIKRHWGVSCKTVDIRPDSSAEIHADYLKINFCNSHAPDMIITNPPFKYFEEIARKGLDDLATGGLLILMMRLEAFESEKRFNFWRSFMPINVYVHKSRKIAKGTVRAPAHFVWQKGSNPEFARIKVI